MNTLLEELAWQATTVYPPDWNTVEALEEFDREKFAMLIVEQCLQVTEQLKRKYKVLRFETSDFDVKHIYAEGETAAEAVARGIKHRFGIETTNENQ